ncbi:MAG TPA: hypothetical protein VER33_22910 [Polyangiaceae bacterium]|nr:hypothetical protein [Polyangiaceae bacterium]
MSGVPEQAQALDLWRRLQPLRAKGGRLHELFSPERVVGLGRAPGRLDVMGGIADYSGSLVLELPIAEAAYVAAQPCAEPTLHVISLDPTQPQHAREVRVPAAPFLLGNDAAAREALPRGAGDAWAAYLLGTVSAWAREHGLQPRGVRLLVASEVPEGKGVSSSAAIEVAALFALAAAAGVTLDPEHAARVCQRVENAVVGAPCGIMDQMTAACGRRGRLLELLCQPATILAHCELPEDLALFGIDSGLRHAVSGPAYGLVRTAAFMGYRLLAAARCLPLERDPGAGLVFRDARWHGYLANVSPSELDAGLLSVLPESMQGAAFLAAHPGVTDCLTRVDPDAVYPVRAATAHPIREHHRVGLFAELLRGPCSERRRRLLGELMYASHESYSQCGLGSPGTDALVALVRKLGPASGLYGAKITGGGSGGTVAVLAAVGAEAAVREVASRYAQSSGQSAQVFCGSSSGAASVAGLTAWV